MNNDPQVKPVNPENYPSHGVVPPIYRVGNQEKNSEIIVGDHRILSWELEGNETEMAEIAGWSEFDHRFDDENGYLDLPQGTRNARSVLSGMEAFENEKASIVVTAANYLETVKKETGRLDHSFSWVSTGVTPERKVFVAPPNLTAKAIGQTETWKRRTVEELRLLLQNDDRNRGLAEEFRKKIAKL